MRIHGKHFDGYVHVFFNQRDYRETVAKYPNHPTIIQVGRIPGGVSSMCDMTVRGVHDPHQKNLF